MALTIKSLQFFSMGNRRVAHFLVDFPDANYTYGGEPLTPGFIRMRKIDIALIECKGGLMFEYDYEEVTLKAIYPRGEILPSQYAEVKPGETTVKSIADSGEIIDLVGEAGVAQGAGQEVKSNVNLAEIQNLRCLFVGF